MERADWLYYSDLCLLGDGGGIGGNIRALHAHGADRVELMMDGPLWDSFQQREDAIAAEILGTGVTCSLHGPCWDVNLTSENREIRDASFRTTLDTVRLARRVGAAHVVVHPGFCQSSAFSHAAARRRAVEAVSRLAEEAAKLGVSILVENVGYRGTELFDEEAFARLLDGFGSEAGYLLDTGHAAINGWDMPALIRELGEKLRCVHLHDNDGRTDEHLPIGDGRIEWAPIIEALGEGKSGRALVLEYRPGTPPERMKEAREVLAVLLGADA